MGPGSQAHLSSEKRTTMQRCVMLLELAHNLNSTAPTAMQPHHPHGGGFQLLLVGAKGTNMGPRTSGTRTPKLAQKKGAIS